MSHKRIGALAYEGCKKRLPLQVLQSAAGHYIGTSDPEEGPCSRESLEYWPTHELAADALRDGNWTQRDNP